MFYRSKLLVFVGPDGSGKTTIIKKVSNRLPDNNIQINHVRFNIIPRFGQFKAFILSLLRLKIITFKEPVISTVGGVVKRYVYGKNIPRWKVFFLLFYELFDYVLGYVQLFSSDRKNIIIFDRYVYDYYTEKDWSNTPLIVMKTIMLLIPKPDFIFYMFNDPVVINNRKNELSVNDIRIVSDRISNLLSDQDNFVVLETSDSPDCIADKVIQRIESMVDTNA